MPYSCLLHNHNKGILAEIDPPIGDYCESGNSAIGGQQTKGVSPEQ